MLYEKLLSIYKEKKLNQEFDESMLNNLFEQIDWSMKRGRRNLSPYKFASTSGVEMNRAVAFFMYFSDPEIGIFDLEYFIECNSNNCQERIYLTKEMLNDRLNILNCEECAKSFSVEEIMDQIKVYFRLSDTACILYKQVGVPEKKKSDPNSIFGILNGMSDNLKSVSPSSSNNTIDKASEGETNTESVSLSTIVEINKQSVTPILDYEFLQDAADFIHG
ncbi:hypothetical protein ABIC86_000120 [Paenibacillus sp. DS2363]|uniref:hypothetical protein n=1 Tax=Paenibacillus sp. DS2363 TaxID=3156427 RepID=UPI003394BA66